MKEHPIIFNTEMVRGILEERKTVTRRPINHYGNFFHLGRPLCDWPLSRPPQKDNKGDWWWILQTDVDSTTSYPLNQSYTNGDHLWVRETWVRHDRSKFKHYLTYQSGQTWIKYKADNKNVYDTGENIKWYPSIHMPRWACRIILEITDIHVERVQDITEEDARREGIIDGGCLNCGEHEPCGCENPHPDARDAYAYLWDSIYGNKYPWSANPWVWVIEFKRVK